MLRELARRGALYERTAHASREVHALALDVGAGCLPDFDGLRVVAKIDADLFQNRIGVFLHHHEAFLGQDLVVGNLARNVGDRYPGARGSSSPLRVAAAGTSRVTGLRVL